MIYTSNVKRAVDIAFKVHSGQLDKGGYPYIMHPLHIAEQMETEDEVIVALLHDTVEDGPIGTIDEIKQNFDTEIIEAIEALTRKDDEKYIDYILRLSRNRIAAIVKLRDLEHNMNKNRTDGEISQSLMDRYKKAYQLLLAIYKTADY